jgi:hypothetical protein
MVADLVSVCHRGQAYFHVYRNMVNSRLKQRGRGPRWLIWLLWKYGVFEFTSIHRDG